MSEEKEEFINPDSWTEKELLKHLYREVRDIRIQMENANKEFEAVKQEVESLSKEIIAIKSANKAKEEEINKRINRNNTIAAVIGTIIAGIALWASMGN